MMAVESMGLSFEPPCMSAPPNYVLFLSYDQCTNDQDLAFSTLGTLAKGPIHNVLQCKSMPSFA